MPAPAEEDPMPLPGEVDGGTPDATQPAPAELIQVLCVCVFVCVGLRTMMPTDNTDRNVVRGCAYVRAAAG